MTTIPDEHFNRICAASGWPFETSATSCPGGVFAVSAARVDPPSLNPTPSEHVFVFGATEAEAIESYRRQVVLRVAQSAPSITARIAAARANLALEEDALALVTATLNP